MANFIIKKKSNNWSQQKDCLHRRRKELGKQIKEGILSKSEMNRGNEGEPEFDKKVQNYDKWKKEKEPLMKDWGKINREFKKHGEESRPHSIDNLRPEGKKLVYD